MKPAISVVVVLWISALLASATWGQTTTDRAKLTEQLDRAKRSVVSETYRLRYQLKAKEALAYRVEHVATVDTTIQGNRQTSKSRSVSNKIWKVRKVDAKGNIQFAHEIASVDMWSQINDNQPVRYDSRSDEKPPIAYENVADTVGKPLSVVTINPAGQVIDRKDDLPQINLGVGGLVVPLPAEPVQIGATWSVPSTVRVRLKDGRPKVIKTRQRYELKSVDAGVATIAVKTQVLTPANDAHTRSQLVQRLTAGEIKFDVDAGRIISKQMNWNETVIGFNGPKSNMKYLAQFTEKLVPHTIETAQKPKAGSAK